MYSFFALSGTTGARMFAGAGALAISAIMMSAAIVPASPAINLTMGALA
ncbi:MAG: hypothetical protein ABJN35_08980 [Erythrobacter sp.]